MTRLQLFFIISVLEWRLGQLLINKRKEIILTIDPKDLRIEGVYPQRQEGYFMQRVKLAAGVLSSAQARSVAAVAERYGRSSIHLTSRGSMEVHWLKEEDLRMVKQEYAKVGLTSRGACGGAVRGITCSSQSAADLPALESLARRLQRHFTGNPRFEGLPKKFKIGIEADYTSGRHLIQDVGLIYAGSDAGVTLYDVWIAGGLGREPRPGFLLAERVPEGRIIPLIEAVIAVYARLAPPPKRLKSLVGAFGEDELRRLIEVEPAFREELPSVSGFPDNLMPVTKGGQRLLADIFAGQLTAGQLRKAADFADRYSGGALQVTANQDLAFYLEASADAESAARELTTVVNSLPTAGVPVPFRICPGSHECKMGLAATRDVAGALIAEMSLAARGTVWALSGCPNSCTQPQLAEAGVVVSRLATGEVGARSPRFDLYRRRSAGFGEKVLEQLTFDELTLQARRL